MGKKEHKATSKDDVLTAACAAYLEERKLVVDILRKSLDFMAYLEAYWNSQRDNGERSPKTIMAKSKMFQALHTIHKQGLRKRVLDVRDRLDRAESKYMKAIEGKAAKR